MATAEDAKLILQLYEMRREEVLRKARSFITGPEFLPESSQEILDMVFGSPEKSAYFRQFATYWDMAAALVNHGTIDAQLFYETNGEYFALWAKIEDFLPDLRAAFGQNFLKNTEKLIANHPDGEARLQAFKARYQKVKEMRNANNS